MYGSKNSNCGFTLIEILITLALTGLIMSSVYAVYIANIRAVTVDEQRVEMQQGQRVSIDFMVRELRHAGYDIAETDTPTIVEAGADYIYFTADLDGDGALNSQGEHIVFCVYDNEKLGYFDPDSAAKVGVIDADNDGFSDPGHTHTAPSHQTLSIIQNLEFYYTLSDGTQTTTPTLDGVDLDDIRAIEISLLSRAESTDPRYTSTAQSFTTAANTVWDGFNDNYRRLMMTTMVRLRNMGL